jgi:hypothetical protein
MKQKMLYAIVVIVILAIVIVGFVYFSPVGKWICGPCGCGGDECGYTGYYWNCTTGLKCSSINPGNCSRTSRRC